MRIIWMLQYTSCHEIQFFAVVGRFSKSFNKKRRRVVDVTSQRDTWLEVWWCDGPSLPQRQVFCRLKGFSQGERLFPPRIDNAMSFPISSRHLSSDILSRVKTVLHASRQSARDANMTSNWSRMETTVHSIENAAVCFHRKFLSAEGSSQY